MPKTHLVILKSSDRNTVTFPQVNNWSVKSSTKLRQVIDIQLVKIKLPSGNTITEDILFLSLSENGAVPDSLIGGDTSPLAGRRLFPIFPNGAIDCQTSQDTTWNLEKNPVDLFRFDIKVLKEDGTLYSFGEAAGDLQSSNQIYILLRIMTLE